VTTLANHIFDPHPSSKVYDRYNFRDDSMRREFTESYFHSKKDEILELLRNPNGYSQNFGNYINHDNPNCMCALGLIMFVLFEGRRIRVVDHRDPQDKVSWVLAVAHFQTDDSPHGLLSYIIRLNDGQHLTFREIADCIEAWYRDRE